MFCHAAKLKFDQRIGIETFSIWYRFRRASVTRPVYKTQIWGVFTKTVMSFWIHFPPFGPKLVNLKSHICNSAEAMAPIENLVNKVIFFLKKWKKFAKISSNHRSHRLKLSGNLPVIDFPLISSNNIEESDMWSKTFETKNAFGICSTCENPLQAQVLSKLGYSCWVLNFIIFHDVFNEIVEFW